MSAARVARAIRSAVGPIGQQTRLSHSNPTSIWYAPNGEGEASKRGVTVGAEVFIGLTLGALAGGLWKMYHWNERHRVEQYYHDLRKLRKAAE